MMQRREERNAGVTSLNGEKRWDPTCRGWADLRKGHRAFVQNRRNE